MSGLPGQDDALNLDAASEEHAGQDEPNLAAGKPQDEPGESVASAAEQEAADDAGSPNQQLAEQDLVEEELQAEDEDFDFDEDEEVGDVNPIEEVEDVDEDEEIAMLWYILKIQVNRESSICEALQRRVKVSGLDRYFGEILVPTEDVREFTKAGKQRTVKRKLYPGYIVVQMALNDETWFLVRETPGIGDFTGSAGKPAPLSPAEIDRIIRTTKPEEAGEEPSVKIGIKFKIGDRIRVKEGYFQNFEGDVETIDESNGRITVMINIFGRPTPVELDHWQVESV